ncbi:MAG: deoxynucleoside kinase [Gemmatimonadaceae bacterium]|nr:deoxynucleoside kinase [Gemmatimonadaceae bacterium]
MPPKSMLLAVAGMVGTGKTTLTRALATRFGLAVALESVDDDNPWLTSYYGADPGAQRQFALRLQLHFLATRFHAMRKMRAQGGGWILDRTWYEDAEIFARGLYESDVMSRHEFDLYQRLYTELLTGPAARPPRLLIYLHGSLDLVVARIGQRGRVAERDMPPSYWKALHARYATWIGGFRRCPILELDIRDYDLLRDPAAIDDIAASVRRRLEPEIPQTELWPAGF